MRILTPKSNFWLGSIALSAFGFAAITPLEAEALTWCMANTISVGHTAGDKDRNNVAYGSALTRRIVNVANGKADTDAVTVAQLKEAIDSAGGGGTWGSISGTLSAQTDLQNALNAKAATSQLQNGNIVIFLKNIPNLLIFLTAFQMLFLLSLLRLLSII